MNNDLISRYALRKSVIDELERLCCVLYKHNEYFQATKKAFNTVLDFIDKAPAVEVEPEKIAIANVSFDENKLKEIVQTEVIEKIKSGELVIKDERPQGEWIYKEFDVESGISHSYWCSNCGEPKSQWCDNFCQRCGADMRKGGAEK